MQARKVLQIHHIRYGSISPAGQKVLQIQHQTCSESKSAPNQRLLQMQARKVLCINHARSESIIRPAPNEGQMCSGSIISRLHHAHSKSTPKRVPNPSYPLFIHQLSSESAPNPQNAKDLFQSQSHSCPFKSFHQSCPLKTGGAAIRPEAVKGIRTWYQECCHKVTPRISQLLKPTHSSQFSLSPYNSYLPRSYNWPIRLIHKIIEFAHSDLLHELLTPTIFLYQLFFQWPLPVLLATPTTLCLAGDADWYGFKNFKLANEKLPSFLPSHPILAIKNFRYRLLTQN
jgi:hypothetical protein